MAKIYGNKGNNFLDGTPGDDFIDGISGDDSLRGFAGDDTLNGGLGVDVLDGGLGSDTLLGGSGNDLLISYAEDDVGTTSDMLLGGGGDDELVSFANASTPANDQIDGGDSSADFAQLNWRETTTAVSFSIADPAIKQFFAGSSLVNVERIFYWGGSGDTIITGGALGDTLYGGSGDDVLNGGGGNDDLADGGGGDDRLYGGEGADSLAAGQGYNELYGGDGDDFLFASREVVQDLGGLIDGGDGYDQLILSGSAFSGDHFFFDYDQFAATAQISGIDSFYLDLIAPPPSDGSVSLTILGGSLDDYLLGDEVNDVLNGRAGDDTLIGRTGKDILTGGEGADRFVFNVEYRYYGVTEGLPDSRAGGGVRDVITDFTPGEDRIDLSQLQYTDVSRISTKAIGSGIIVYYDVDGDGADFDQDFAVQLNGLTTISESDFIFATL